MTSATTYQELPAALLMMSYSSRVLSPARAPSAIASAAAAMCTPASSWFTIFTLLHECEKCRDFRDNGLFLF